MKLFAIENKQEEKFYIWWYREHIFPQRVFVCLCVCVLFFLWNFMGPLKTCDILNLRKIKRSSRTCTLPFVLGWLFGFTMCVHGFLHFGITLVCAFVCMSVCGWKHFLQYQDPKHAETYQGDISNSCSQRY